MAARFCTPRMVNAAPSVECSANWSANSRQPRGSLFWCCTRVGPERIAFGRLFHGQLLEALGRGFRFLGELRALVGRRAVAAARDHHASGRGAGR